VTRTILAIAALTSLACHPWDRDGDGSWHSLRAPFDCNDANPSISPHAEDTPLNGVDEDCSGRDSYRGANVLLVVIDALRPDFLAPYGGDPEIAPALQSLSEGSLVYSTAIAQSSCTMPSIPSLLTSRLPSKLYPSLFAKETKHVPLSFPKDVRMLPEILSASGYTTVGYVTNPLLGRWIGKRGFTNYRFVDRPCRGFENYGTASEIREAALDWVSTYTGAAPFFMYLHLMDVHTKPCHLEYEAEKVKDRWEWVRLRYAERVKYADAQVGMILEEFKKKGLLDKTLVLVTADHGEELGDHRGSRHCHTLLQESIRIPLLFKVPAAPAGSLIDEPVMALDITPTLLELLEIPFDDREFDGAVLPPFGEKVDLRPLVSELAGQASLQEGK
jgi:arylsulfatase